ncbi:amino acid racemase [Chryseobacterium sp. PS-8]|uniref:Amino acid racemase n=1 Tax=Chryseobacterium indicum TaxID=2766954 RepID=A0ABS9C6Z2_9FLAO|nr:amino acid racemase [Chryseobacterium sp. PS-8]MCF2220326.1 amino acid racemase [Chryseobacterium sp. PS-8]
MDMTIHNDNIIGIVGGMGPKAGLNLFDKILKYTDAKTDQDHISVILASLPKYIIDRTKFLKGETDINPALNIVKIIRKLENSGANIIGLACNTSYAPEIYNAIIQELSAIKSRIKLIHMPVETCRYLKENYPDFSKIGLMTTNGTYKSGLYKELLENSGYDVIIPDHEFQDNVIHRLIYDKEMGIKAYPDTKRQEQNKLLAHAMEFFKKHKAEAIIIGCTELSILMNEQYMENILIVDPSEILAMKLIKEARKCEAEKQKIIS